jgi:hypothetical protein
MAKTMKLSELVARIQAAGLVATNTVSKAGDLHIHAETSPPCSRAGETKVLFNCILDSSTNRPNTYFDAARITEVLSKAAEHPDVIRHRKLLAKWAKEDVLDKAARATT